MLDANSIFRVDGIVAVITGGATGIGWMMAEGLAANGAARIYLLGRRAQVIKEAAAKYPEIMVPVECDVSSQQSLQAAVDEVSKTTKHINLLVANSGVGGTGVGYSPDLTLSQLREHLMASSMEKFTETLHVNTTGAWFTMVAFLELLDAGNKHAVSAGATGGGGGGGGGGGNDGNDQKKVVFGAPRKAGGKAPSIQSQVIFTTSLASVSRGHWTKPDYGSSKAALGYLMKQAATNLARYGIRANALAPGLFPSDLAAPLLGGRNPEEEGPDHTLFIPSQKFGEAREMAGSLLYLASAAGSFTNGNVILFDGGRAGIIPASY